MRTKINNLLLPVMIVMGCIILCPVVRSQTIDSVPPITLPQPYEELSIYDHASVKFEYRSEKNSQFILNENFQPAKKIFEKDSLYFPDSSKSLWIKFQLVNQRSTDTTIALIFKKNVGKAVIYRAEGDSLVFIGRAGFVIAALARYLFYQEDRIDLLVKAHSAPYYFINVTHYHFGYLPEMPVLTTIDRAEVRGFQKVKFEKPNLLWYHFFAGIFFMFFVFGFIKYLVLGKDKAYLYYSLLGLFSALFSLAQTEYPPLEFPWFENIRGIEFSDLLITLIFVMHGLFILEILQLKSKFPRITRILKWYLFLKLLLYLILAAQYVISHGYSEFLNTLMMYDHFIFHSLLLIWVIYLATIRKGFYRFIFWGGVTIVLAYTVMFVVAYFELFSLLPSWFQGDARGMLFRFMSLGLVIDMIFYFTALAYRDRQVERDKLVFQEQLIKQMEANKVIQENFTSDLAQQVKEKTAEVVKEKGEVESTLQALRSSQAQLIHSEKMASLGELTAGIAHEIQNPLNFVNNFSEVNTELIDELKHELETGNKEEAISIADDIKENEEKISLHGKRADAIVKGMLQHSRSSTGKKEPVNINALADEYLRLSYHGLRAKDKIFNATLETEYDPNLDGEEAKINIVPQEIGRVLLNLFTNAFYAVTEKIKQTESRIHLRNVYEPKVIVSTKQLSGKVQICVTDNGEGIPPDVIDKIFQPFFTTKPSGQGTGLGLSLSYDIIKSHGGEITVNSEIGKKTIFCIELPY
jgi:signal transduction histidine kinase